MKKYTQRALAVMLVIALLLGLGLTASADTEKKKMVCLGDGVAGGLGMLSDYDGNEYTKSPLDTSTLEVVLNPLIMAQAMFYGYQEGSIRKIVETPTFSRQAAETLGYEYVDLSCTGIRLTDIYSMLNGDGFPDDNLLLKAYMNSTMLLLKGLTNEDWNTTAYEFYTEKITEEIKDASVVVVSLGLNDVTLSPAYNLVQNHGDEELTITDFLQAVIDGQVTLLETVPKLLKLIRSLNSNCEILLTGIYNPLAKVSLIGDDGQTLVDFSNMLAAVNTSYAAEALIYDATYVSITGAADYFPEVALDITDLQEGGKPIDFLKDLLSIRTHPGLEGHTYIAQQILNKFTTQVKNGTYLTYLGGQKVGELTYKRSALGWTIRTADGKYVKNDDGKVVLADKATVWRYDGGLYCKVGEKKSFLKIFTITVYSKRYLTFDGTSFGLSSAKVNATLYNVN